MITQLGDLDLVESKYGRLLVPRTDPYIARSLRDYGEFSETEVNIFREYIRPGDVVCDIGANIGAHTLALARLVGSTGAVFSFEPLLTNYWLLCANVALNLLYRVRPVHAAIAREPGQIHCPVIPYAAEVNFGGLSLANRDLTGEIVQAITLDDLHLPPVRFMKIDVEHMEPEVLGGGFGVIQRDRPVLYFEANDATAAERSMHEIEPLGYRMMWHFAPLYNPANIRGNMTDMEDLTSRNVLALPEEEDFPANPYLFTKEQGDEAITQADRGADACR